MKANAIGTKIKRIREFKNYTQEYMAEKLGVGQSTYARFEKDDSDLTISRLKKISEVLDVKLEDLINANEQIVFNNYGEFKGTQSGNYHEYPLELIELYKDKIKLLEDKITLIEALMKK